MGRRRCGGKEERVLDWETSHGSGGDGSLSLVVGEKCSSWATRSRSDWERSSMKCIRFCILNFWRMELVVLVFVFALRF